ncbi:MAG: hypothetical protein ACI935_003788, partial [Moritella dasanensis]
CHGRKFNITPQKRADISENGETKTPTICQK